MRTFFVLTEKNITDSVFPFFDYQTMTSSESQVSRRLMSLETAEQLSLSAHGAAYYDVVFNLDFSKWNLRFNSNNTAHLMKWFDNFFGLVSTTSLMSSSSPLSVTCRAGIILIPTWRKPTGITPGLRMSPKFHVLRMWWRTPETIIGSQNCIYNIWSNYSDLTRPHPKLWFSGTVRILSGQIIIFHQPRFPWNKGISLTIYNWMPRK